MANNFLVRIHFVAPFDTADWHETWYTEADASGQALTHATAYAEHRAAILAPANYIDRITVSDVEKFRDVRVFTTKLTGQRQDNQPAEKTKPDYPNLGILCQFFADDTIWRHLLLRGLPDRYLGGPESKEGLFSFNQKFVSLLQTIRENAHLKIRHLNPKPARFQIVDIAIAEGVFTLQLDGLHGLKVNDKIVIRGVKGPAINGRHRVAAVSLAGHVTITKRGVEQRDIFNYGTVQKLDYAYAGVSSGQVLRVATHNTRVPFDGRAGRSKSKKR